MCFASILYNNHIRFKKKKTNKKTWNRKNSLVFSKDIQENQVGGKLLWNSLKYCAAGELG